VLISEFQGKMEMIGQKDTKLKRESWNAPTLTKAHPNSLKPETTNGSRSSELNLAQASSISLK